MRPLATLPVFKDTPCVSAKDKAGIWRNFGACVEDRSLDRMDKRAYTFYRLHCGFIAHFNIHGFRDVYSGADFLRFLRAFVEPAWNGGLSLRRDLADIGRALRRLAFDALPVVESECACRAHNAKVEQLRRLADELGYRVVPKDEADSAPAAVLVGVESSGQLTLGF